MVCLVRKGSWGGRFYWGDKNNDPKAIETWAFKGPQIRIDNGGVKSSPLHF